MDRRTHMQSFVVERTRDIHSLGRWLHRYLPVTYSNYIYRTYCKYEIPDHKVGIYCNVIGPLAELRHSAFSCKKVLRYFGKVQHQSNVRII